MELGDSGGDKRQGDGVELMAEQTPRAGDGHTHEPKRGKQHSERHNIAPLDD